MQPNGIRSLWAAGRPVFNGWLSSGSPFVAEILAAQGYDSITIDQQHGLFGYETMLGTLQALGRTAVTPLVRIPWLDPTGVAKALDGGAQGIICPMIGTREEAERLVSYMRYPPEGTRSSGPTRAALRKVLAWKPERLLIAHGSCAQTGATEISARALRWI